MATIELDRPAATRAWSARVRKVGGYIQLAFAAFWLIRGGLTAGGATGGGLALAGAVAVLVVLGYALRRTTGTGGLPVGREAKRIERSVTIATVVELAASVVLPVIVTALGHSDWVLPSIAVTIGPLLLWLGHVVVIPRLRPVGWVLTVGPFVLVAALSGNALAVTTGLASGLLLLATAAAGFHDLSLSRPHPAPTDAPAPVAAVAR